MRRRVGPDLRPTRRGEGCAELFGATSRASALRRADGLSERTANRRLSNIFAELGVRTRTAAARVAIEAGLTG